MKQNVHPGIAAFIIACAVAAAAFFIWYGNRDRPIQEKFIPPGERQAMVMQGKAPGGPGAPMRGGPPAGAPDGAKPGAPNKPAEGGDKMAPAGEKTPAEETR